MLLDEMPKSQTDFTDVFVITFKCDSYALTYNIIW